MATNRGSVSVAKSLQVLGQASATATHVVSSAYDLVTKAYLDSALVAAAANVLVFDLVGDGTTTQYTFTVDAQYTDTLPTTVEYYLLSGGNKESVTIDSFSVAGTTITFDVQLALDVGESVKAHVQYSDAANLPVETNIDSANDYSIPTSKAVKDYLTSTATTVGDIRNSMLSLTQFQSLNGVGWVLMDGGNCTGSAYHTITGQTSVPDARGCALRMLDPTGLVDSDGASRTLGDYQEDADQRVQGDFGSSFQGLSSMNASGAFTTRAHTQPRYPQPIGSGSQSTGWSFDNDTVIRTADESRMKNIAVNYFIRIN